MNTNSTAYKYIQSRKPLGRGTFCSIAVCYAIDDGVSGQNAFALKSEVSEFHNSGIMDGEARCLEYLSRVLKDRVPKFIDYLPMKDVYEPEKPHVFVDRVCNAPSNDTANVSSVSGKTMGLVMELLDGEDMHELVHRSWRERENVASDADKNSSSNGQSKRIDPREALQLTEMVLDSLKSIHNAGMVHRDVKPSNFVRVSTDANNKEFKVVDFGLTKSFVVPVDATDAALDKEWKGTSLFDVMDGEKSEKIITHYRKPRERGKAEFRGSSMYASPNIHNLEEYSPRDDIFSCLFIFLDLVAGGLPWASAASQRKRDECGRIKEKCMDDPIRFFEGDIANTYGEKIKHLVSALGDVVTHLRELSYYDLPDYEMIYRRLDRIVDLLEDSTRTFNCSLQWKSPRLLHRSMEKDIVYQHHFLQMKNVFSYKTLDSDTYVLRLSSFLAVANLLTQESWPDQFEIYPDYYTKTHRRDNLTKMLKSTLDFAAREQYFASKKYFDVTDGKRRKTLVNFSNCIFCLQMKLNEELRKPTAPPPSLALRR